MAAMIGERLASLNARLGTMHGLALVRFDAEVYDEPASNPIYAVGTRARWSDGTELRSQFWRLTEHGRTLISVFDHGQRYGLAAPIDAFVVVRERLVGRPLESVRAEPGTADLVFAFPDGLALRVFNFTAYEIWELSFPDGTGEYSNHVGD